MSEYEDRVRDFLEFWEMYAVEFHASFAEGDVCEPPCEPETDPDVICGEYQNGHHVLRASDLRALLGDLVEARGPDEWAVVTWHPNEEDGGIAQARVLRTFQTLEEAAAHAAACGVPGATVAFWDDNGHESGWR